MVNSKHAFWIALLLTIFVFASGMFFGIFFEQSRLSKINTLFYRSEISLMDSLTYSALADSSFVNCTHLIYGNLRLADNVYQEAQLLEDYGSKTNFAEEDFFIAHQRYDLLRTLLWIQSSKIKQRCLDNPQHVIYFYNYSLEDINQRAEQAVWSKLLTDLKERNGADILLIPIAVDTNVTALQPLLQQYHVDEFPSVLIDERVLIISLQYVDVLEQALAGNSTSKTTPR